MAKNVLKNRAYKTFHESCSPRIISFPQDTPKKLSTYEAPAKNSTVNFPIIKKATTLPKPPLNFPKLKPVKFFAQPIIIIIGLLAFREPFPAAAESLTPVYAFLDTVVLPIINWAYRLALKCFNEIMSWEWFSSIINWFNNLAM